MIDLFIFKKKVIVRSSAKYSHFPFEIDLLSGSTVCIIALGKVMYRFQIYPLSPQKSISNYFVACAGLGYNEALFHLPNVIFR